MPGFVGGVGVQPGGQLSSQRSHLDATGTHNHTDDPLAHGSGGGGTYGTYTGSTQISQS